jgi:hypothetical protein
MQKYQNAITNTNGDVVPNAIVTVTVYGTGLPASLYTGNGTGLLPSNVVATDSQGEFSFYAANGRYSYSVAATNYTAEVYTDFLLFDPASTGAVTATNVSFAPTGALTSTNVQAAINEVVTDLAGSTGAANVGFAPTGALAATNVQAAITEVVSDLAASSGSSTVGFLQSGTGAVARTLQAKGRDSVNVADFGAVGDGVTNDTAAINAAITAVLAAGGGTVFFSAKNYKVTTLNISSGVYLQGQGAAKRSAKNMTLLTGTAGYNVIEIDPNGATDIAIRHLGTYGGNRSVSFDPTVNNVAVINFEMYDVTFGFPTNECVFIGGQAERLRFSFLNFSNGTYGYYHGIGLTGRSYAIFEKSTWEHIYMEGQTINGIFYDTVNVSGSTAYTFMKFNNTGRESIRIKGNVGGLTFTDVLFENTASSSPTPANTTGNMTAGSPTLVVASATNFVIGQQVTVSGAGIVSGYGYCDLEANILNIVGTTLTLSANASYAVTGAPVTNRRYDTVKFEGIAGAGISYNILFNGCFLDGGFVKARYVLNTGASAVITLTGTVGQAGGPSGTPIYDPTSQVTFLNGYSGTRVAKTPGQTKPMSAYYAGGVSSFPNGAYNGDPAVVEYPPTLISAPPGQSVITTLMASNVNGGAGATWGNFEIFIKDPNFNSIFQIAGKNGLTDAKLAVGTRLGLPAFGGSGSYTSYSNAEIMVADAIPTVGTWYTGSIIFKASPAGGQPIGWQNISGGTPGTWLPMGYLNYAQMSFGTAPPSTGNWYQGSVVFNTNAAVGQVAGWQCTVGGSPGTWTPLGYVYDQTITFATAAPTTGTWVRGSVAFNSTAAVGSPKGWQCTVAGTPGTWVSMGNL